MLKNIKKLEIYKCNLYGYKLMNGSYKLDTKDSIENLSSRMKVNWQVGINNKLTEDIIYVYKEEGSNDFYECMTNFKIPVFDELKFDINNLSIPSCYIILGPEYMERVNSSEFVDYIFKPEIDSTVVKQMIKKSQKDGKAILKAIRTFYKNEVKRKTKVR